MDIADFVDSGSDGDWAAEGEDTEHNEEEPYNASVPPLDDSNDDSSTPMDLDGEDNSGKADDADETVENAETNTDDVTSGTEETVTSRRSGRVRKQRSYKEWQSEDETESSSEETEDGVMKEEEYIPDFNYDKLIGRRPSKTKEGKWEYLVTFKKCSYLHTNWVPEEDIISHGSREKQKIKRYVAKERRKQREVRRKKRDEKKKHFQDFEYIYNAKNNDTPAQINDNDIVSDNSSDDDDLKIETSTEALYLVKWRGLAYEASTWERACDVDDDLKIAQFRQIMQRVRSNARMKQKGKNIFSELIVDPEGLYDIPLMKMLRHAAQTLHIKYKTMAAQSGVTSSQISNYLRQHHMGKKTLKKIQPLLREWHDTYCKPRLEDFEIRGCLDELCEAITWEQGSIDTKVYLEKAKNDIALKKSELEKKQLIFKTQEKDAKFEKFQRLTMRREERLQRKSVYSKKMQIYSEKIAERNKELQERKNMRKEEATQRKNISENNLIVDEKLEKLEQPIDYTFDLRSDSDEEPEPETKKVYYDLQVPPGLKTGDLLSFEAPDGNNRTKKYTIQVPAGVSTGDTLRCAVNVTVPNDVSKSSKDISRLELLRRDLAIFEDVVKVAEDNLQKELNRAAEAISKNPYILKMKQKKAMEESRMKVLERQRLRREQEASTDETNKIKNQSLNDPENNENAMKEENKENSEEQSTNSQTSEMNIDKNLTNETTTATKPPPMPQKNPLARAPGTYKSGNALRSYQLAGLKWLANNYSQGRSCILADEMGLGPFLVVAPLSTLGHWKRTFETWTDMNVCFYYDGNGRGMPFDPSAGVMKFNVLLTSYEILYSDREFLEEIPWQATVIDEGHRLRNMKSKILGAFEEMDSLWSLLLTGTPLQNNLMELWTLLDFVAPRRFGTAEEFEYQYGELTSSEQVQSLQKRMAPYVLRRVKEDVEKSILKRKQYYRAIYDRNRSFLYKGVRKSNHPLLNNMHMQLRKCCNHPFLINERGYKEKVLKFEEFLETPVAYQYEIACTDADHVGEWSGKWEASSQDDDVSAYDVIFRKGKNYDSSSVPATSISSGKMLLLDKLLPKLKKEGHRVLIFSQMVIMLDILQDYLNLRSIKFERLDGSTHGNKRQASIDRFTAEGSDRFVFLLSTRAGGVGINLTAADTVIIFDSDWNPQNDMQATARCHRIGQKKQVTVYRFLMRNSYESTMFEVASRKLAMEQAVMGRRTLQASEMDQLLRHGAYAVMGGDNDNKETKSFQNASIDDILSRHSRSETSAMSHDDDGDDVDVDDPDFWSKVLPNMLSADGLLARLNDGSMASEPTATRNLFLEEVEELAQEQTSDDEGATPGPSAHETEVACSLLLQISTMRTSFTERQRETAEGWLAELEGGRLRKRGSVRNGNRKRDRKRKRGYNDNSDDDFNDSDDVFEDRAGLTLARVLADDYLLMSELKRLIEKKDYVTGLRDALLDECDNRDIDVGHNPRSMHHLEQRELADADEEVARLLSVLGRELENHTLMKQATNSRRSTTKRKRVAYPEGEIISTTRTRKTKHYDDGGGDDFDIEEAPEQSSGDTFSRLKKRINAEHVYVANDDESPFMIAKKHAKLVEGTTLELPPKKDQSHETQKLYDTHAKHIEAFLHTHELEDGEQWTELFFELPDKELYPDYYKLIKSPIDLIMISKSIDAGKYRSLSAFANDIDLMFSNAKKYNMEGSLILEDVEYMENYFIRKLEMIQIEETKINSQCPEYDALDNETPEEIAAKLSVSLQELLDANINRFPGISATSKLEPGTNLLLPMLLDKVNPPDGVISFKTSAVDDSESDGDEEKWEIYYNWLNRVSKLGKENIVLKLNGVRLTANDVPKI
eukprot:GSMAST32.ASY1.ANO1.1534.1 assembled CDS